MTERFKTLRGLASGTVSDEPVRGAFYVTILHDAYYRRSGLVLRAGDRYPAKMGARAGEYYILVRNEWHSINADLASVDP